MKKSPFFILCVGTNIVFLFLYVHKASQCTYVSYRKQELEAQKKDLMHAQQVLEHKICMTKSRAEVTEFAQNQLNMKSVSIKQVKKMPTVDTTFHPCMQPAVPLHTQMFNHTLCSNKALEVGG